MALGFAARDQVGVDPLDVVLVLDTRRPAAERQDAQRRLRHQLQLGLGLDPRPAVVDQVEAAVDRLAERRQPEVADRHPQLQGSAGAGQLDPVVREVDLTGDSLDVLEVVRRDLERLAQRLAVADQERAGLDRLVQPLVRVERDRVGELDAAKRLGAALRQAGEPAVRRVDVQPHALLAADPRQVGQRVDGARVGGACVGDDHGGAPAGGPVGLHRAAQRGGAHTHPLVGGKHAHLVGAEAEHARPAGQRGVGLVGQVQHRVLGHRADQRLAGARQGGQVGRRPARDQDAAGRLRVADPVPEPADHRQLQRSRPRGAQPPAGVEVERAGDQVAQRAGPGRLSGDERHVPGVAQAGDVGEDVALDALQDRVEAGRILGRRHGDAREHVLRCDPADHWAGIGGQSLDQHVHGAIAEAAHRLGVQRQR